MGELMSLKPIKRGTAHREVSVSIGDKDGDVILHFGQDVTWIALHPEQAIEIGLRMIHQAAAIMGMEVEVEILDKKPAKLIMPVKH